MSSETGRAWLARAAALLVPLWALTVLGLAASGLPLPARAAEQEVVRQGVMNGAYKPLTAIIAELGRQHPGRVVDVESKRGLQGDLRYEITLVDSAGRKQELLVDAATGRVISQDQDVLRQAASLGQLAAYLRRVEQQQGRRVVDTIQKNGYFATYELQKQYGHWTAKATSQQGVRSYMLVNDANGAFHAVSKADLGTRLPSAAQVADKLRAMGYAIVRDVDFENGLWEAEVRQHRNSPKIELLLHPVTLEVLNQPGPSAGGNNPGHVNGPVLTAQQVIQALQRAGYTHIHDLEFDDGRWEAEAINPAGQRVDLHINPYTGAVERERLDN